MDYGVYVPHAWCGRVWSAFSNFYFRSRSRVLYQILVHTFPFLSSHFCFCVPFYCYYYTFGKTLFFILYIFLYIPSGLLFFFFVGNAFVSRATLKDNYIKIDVPD